MLVCLAACVSQVPAEEDEQAAQSAEEHEVEQAEDEGVQTADGADDEPPRRPRFSIDDDSREDLDERLHPFPETQDDIIRQAQQVAPLTPNERLRPQPPSAAPPSSDSSRSMLGPQTLSSITAGQGRARLLSRGRASAPAMIGDFFGGAPGASSVVFGTPFELGATQDHGAYIDDFIVIHGNTIVPFAHCWAPSSGFVGDNGLVNASGAIVAPNGDLQAVTNLVPIDHVGGVIPGGAPVAATATGLTIAGFNQLPTNVPFDASSPIYAIRPVINVILPNPGAGGAGLIGRAKISENTSPMPRDRVFFNYNYFNNVPLAANGVNVNRFTPGFEKTFFDGMTSFEMRFPFATTLNNNIVADGTTNTGTVLFGDISMAFKALVYTNDTLAVSCGLQMMLPTAPALNVGLTDGTQLIRVNNNTVNLMPFVGALYTPNDRFFTQGFLQFDTPANGNSVYVNNFDGGPLSAAGSIRDVTYVYADIGTGYWLYRNDDAQRVTGFSTTTELHYNQSLQPTNVLSTGLYQIGSSFSNLSMLNMVVGGNVHFGLNKTLSVGYVAPIGNGSDQMFNGELRAFFNYRFGPQTFRTRTTL